MSYQDNVNIAYALFDALNARDHAKFMDLHDPACESFVSGSTRPLNAEQIWKYLDRFFVAFPDVQWEIQQAIAGAHHVVVHWTAEGTNSGPLTGPASGRELPVTNKRGQLMGSTTFRIDSGLITQSWLFWDLAALLVQVGLLTL